MYMYYVYMVCVCSHYKFVDLSLYSLMNGCNVLAHLSRRLKGELIVYRGIRRPASVCPSTFSNDISSEAVRQIISIFHI